MSRHVQARNRRKLAAITVRILMQVMCDRGAGVWFWTGGKSWSDKPAKQKMRKGGKVLDVLLV